MMPGMKSMTCKKSMKIKWLTSDLNFILQKGNILFIQTFHIVQTCKIFWIVVGVKKGQELKMLGGLNFCVLDV